MPIRIQNDLPAKEILEKENIFVMDESRALSQEIRPLKVGILNLMPLKEDTELQLLRSFSNTPLQCSAFSFSLAAILFPFSKLSSSFFAIILVINISI